MKATKTTYKITLPDGTEQTRTTNHSYTHAIVGYEQARESWRFVGDPSNEQTETYTIPGSWGVLMWTANPAQALRKYEGSDVFSGVYAQEVQNG